MPVFANAHSEIASSLFGALLRENFWLYGVPFSLLPVLLARPRRECWLLWGCLAAELASRVISPKTVVSTTGPIYMAEAIPFLTLAAWRRTWCASAPPAASALEVRSIDADSGLGLTLSRSRCSYP